ncbi:hypothetical protein [Limnovirga soli]|uniref:Uncharacterized protein n=1 Tax=Limnovirga soli TaxID=2656915 RepID=A0A8J8FG04_9BACT|nr:hypothetical protein [Limnovirga soli]NNV57360.1 hypothetical protein [Limnovirga soli]
MSENTTPPAPTPQLNALNVFCSLYAPASENNFTDTFTSLAIQHMVEKHTGIDLMLMELHEMMQQMHYEYLMIDDEFVWIVKRDEAA